MQLLFFFHGANSEINGVFYHLQYYRTVSLDLACTEINNGAPLDNFHNGFRLVLYDKL